MEEQIKRAVRNLNISYIFFWVLPALEVWQTMHKPFIILRH